MITEAQRDLRKKHIGSSDAPAVLGLSPWRSPVDVWLEKTADIKADEPNPAMAVGNRLEPVIIDFALERLDGKYTSARRNVRRVATNGVMAANLDCQLNANTRTIPLEVKFASNADEWGTEDQGLEGVPVSYLAQVLHQMAVVESPQAYLAVCLMGYRLPEFRLYEIVPPQSMLEAIERKEVEWWNTYVVPKVKPPSDEPADLDILSRVKREPGKSIVVADALVAEFVAKNKAAKVAIDDAERAKSELLTALGDAEAATWSGGSLTYHEQTRKAYAVKETTFRMLRVKEAK